MLGQPDMKYTFVGGVAYYNSDKISGISQYVQMPVTTYSNWFRLNAGTMYIDDGDESSAFPIVSVTVLCDNFFNFSKYFTLELGIFVPFNDKTPTFDNIGAMIGILKYDW